MKLKGLKVQSKRDGKILKVLSEISDGFIDLEKEDGSKITVAESTFKRYYTEKIDKNFKPVVAEEPKAIQSTTEAHKVAAKSKTPKKEKSAQPVKLAPPAKVKDPSFIPIKSLFNFAKYNRKRDFVAGYEKLSKEGRAKVMSYIESKKDAKANSFLTKNGIK